MSPRFLSGVAAALALGAASSALGYHEPGEEWVNNTAYTLRGGEFSLGLFQWQAGILDEVMVGTFLVLWAASPFLKRPVPNGYFKLRDWFHGPLAVSLRGTFLYVNAGKLLDEYTPDRGDAAKLWVTGANAAVTYRSDGAWSVGPELAYTHLHLSGDSPDQAVEGAAAASTLRAGLWAEWRFTHWVALHVTSRVLLHRQEFQADAEFDPNDTTHVEAELYEEDPPPLGAWNVVPGVALSGDYLNFYAGVGYGHGWVPVVGLVTNERSFFLRLDFFARFEPF